MSSEKSKVYFGSFQNGSYELIEILSPEETAKMEPPKRVFEGEPSFF
jgi:hypothetical protein